MEDTKIPSIQTASPEGQGSTDKKKPPVRDTSIIAPLVAVVIITGIVVWFFMPSTPTPAPQVADFVACVAAGNPVMESYPRQCRHEGRLYIEVIASPMPEVPTQSPQPAAALTEPEARAIAEATCIKGGESLAPGYYNEGTGTWWFDANLNATKEGCNPACVVSNATKTAEVNWRCTGLRPLPNATAEALRELLAEKYPAYAKTLSVRLLQETESHVRGSVSFAPGAPGGIMLAVRTEGVWKVVHDGNGHIPCSLARYGFPSDMLTDCAQ